jgi:hypothetical protein
MGGIFIIAPFVMRASLSDESPSLHSDCTVAMSNDNGSLGVSLSRTASVNVQRFTMAHLVVFM